MRKCGAAGNFEHSPPLKVCPNILIIFLSLLLAPLRAFNHILVFLFFRRMCVCVWEREGGRRNILASDASFPICALFGRRPPLFCEISAVVCGHAGSVVSFILLAPLFSMHRAGRHPPLKRAAAARCLHWGKPSLLLRTCTVLRTTYFQNGAAEEK